MSDLIGYLPGALLVLHSFTTDASQS
jgi:hypothetical protein